MRNILFLILVLFCQSHYGQTIEDLLKQDRDWRKNKIENFERPIKVRGDVKIIRKIENSDTLTLEVFQPVNWTSRENWPAIILFHGGGWHGGNKLNLSPFAQYFASLGMVAILPDYEKSNEKLGKYFNPQVCVKDGRDIIKFVLLNYKKLKIDTNNISLSGSSSGAHIATAVAICPDKNNWIFPAKSLILYSAVLDLPFDFKKRDCKDLDSSNIELLNRLNPLKYVDENTPPILLFSGDIDPDGIGCRRLVRIMADHSNTCELYLAKNERHGFDSFEPWHSRCTKVTSKFLFSHKIISGEVKENLREEACNFEKFDHKEWVDDYNCWLDLWTRNY